MGMPIRKTKKTTDKPGPKQSVSETKRELAMQNRSTGKKIGPKARAQRLAAKGLGKSVKYQEKAAAKRGGSKSAGPGYVSKATDKDKAKAAGTSIRVSTPYNRITRIDMSKKPIKQRAKR
jgi:hypothetical protein